MISLFLVFYCCLKYNNCIGLLDFLFFSSNNVPFRHNEPEGSACVGAVPEDGHILGLLQSSAGHRERLLQGTCVACCVRFSADSLHSEMFTHSALIWILFISGLEPEQKSLAILKKGPFSRWGRCSLCNQFQ